MALSAADVRGRGQREMRKPIVSVMAMALCALAWAEPVDVVVVGGGPAGIGAALAAAGCGAKTVLVERDARLGGTTVSAEVLPMGLFDAWGRQIIDGPCWTLVTNAVALGEGRLPDVSKQDVHALWNGCVRVNPVVYSALAAETLEKAGVEVRFNAAACGIRRADGGWTLQLATDEGLGELSAKVVVDATGNAAVAANSAPKQQKQQIPLLIFIVLPNQSRGISRV